MTDIAKTDLVWHDHTVLSRTGRVEFNPLDDEFLAIDAAGGVCYSLNASAGQVWQLLEPPIQFGILCARLAEIYGESEATIRADLPELLFDLKKAGLLATEDEKAA